MKTLITYFCLLFTITNLFAQPQKVKVVTEKNRYVLYRNDEPYYIKGACGFAYYDKLRAYGGNSIRVWTTEKAKEQLDKAHALGLTVTLGLFLKPERMGFDYNNKQEVQKQLEQVKKEVLKYKDHPALLMWGIGNEVELFAKNPKVWDAINDIAKMIKEVDPNHPTTTMLAGVPEKHMPNIIKRCPDLDLLSINVFKDIPYVDQKLKAAGWNGPYLISEWGSDGYWETETTKWDRFLEFNSTIKAAQYKSRFEIIKKNNHCIGSYVFLWGHKQERSHTFYSLILDSGHETESIDVLHYLWKGKWPEYRAPQIKEAFINKKTMKDNIYLKAGTSNIAEVKLQNLNSDEELYYYWELLPETNDLRDGGEGETKPPVIVTAISDPRKESIKFIAPEKPGAYRLFVHVYTNKNKAATANIPFYVNP
jgi:hypothetical protein